VELAGALNLNEAGSFELLDVVRERGGGDGQRGAGLGATERASGLGDALKEIETARVGEGFEDGGAAFGRYSSGFGWR